MVFGTDIKTMLFFGNFRCFKVTLGTLQSTSALREMQFNHLRHLHPLKKPTIKKLQFLESNHMKAFS